MKKTIHDCRAQRTVRSLCPLFAPRSVLIYSQKGLCKIDCLRRRLIPIILLAVVVWFPAGSSGKAVYADYANIITSAPVALTEKDRLLRLRLLRNPMPISVRRRAYWARRTQTRTLFFDSHNTIQFLSPLYCAKVYNGELPEECRFMEKLSEKFHENPDFGKVIRDVGQYLGFSQR